MMIHLYDDVYDDMCVYDDTCVYDDNDYECVVAEQRADRRVPEVCAILTKLNHGNFVPFSSDGERAQCFVKNPKKHYR